MCGMKQKLSVCVKYMVLFNSLYTLHRPLTAADDSNIYSTNSDR